MMVMEPLVWGADDPVSAGIWAALQAYCRVLDQADLDAWVDLFDETARYKVITAENLDRGFRLGLLDDNKARMRDRVLFIRRFWNTEPVRYRHLITPLGYYRSADGTVSGETSFAVFRTRPAQGSDILAVGVYRDCLVPTEQGWKFRERIAVLDTALVTEMQYPI